MRNRSVRLAVVAGVVLAMAGAAVEIWRLEVDRGAGLRATRAFDATIRSSAAGLAELRAAQEAYVADGQSEGNWFGRASSALESLRAALAESRSAATSPDAGQAILAAADLLASFEKLDDQARGLVRSEQRLMASDLIFGDAASTLTVLGTRLDEAQVRQAADSDRRLSHTRTLEAVTASAAAVVALVGLLLLLPAGGAARQSEEEPSLSEARTAPAEAPTSAPPPVPPQAPAFDLERIARLCVELGRAGDPAALPRLIERTASLLDASGLIVWMASPKAGVLQPVLSHGYSAPALARIGELAPDEDNATAEAFRSGEARVVEGSGGANGAIAVPIITPTGCAGVLAAEIRNGGEKNAATQAVAAIVAAQLASLSSSSSAVP